MANELCIFIDIVNEILIFLSIYFVIHNWKAEVVEVGAYLVKAAGFGGGFNKADFPVVGVGTGAQGFKFSESWVCAGDHGLADIDPTGLVFAKTVQGLIDHP